MDVVFVVGQLDVVPLAVVERLAHGASFVPAVLALSIDVDTAVADRGEILVIEISKCRKKMPGYFGLRRTDHATEE